MREYNSETDFHLVISGSKRDTFPCIANIKNELETNDVKWPGLTDEMDREIMKAWRTVFKLNTTVLGLDLEAGFGFKSE